MRIRNRKRFAANTAYVTRVFELLGDDPDRAAGNARDVMRMEAALAARHASCRAA